MRVIPRAGNLIQLLSADGEPDIHMMFTQVELAGVFRQQPPRRHDNTPVTLNHQTSERWYQPADRGRLNILSKH